MESKVGAFRGFRGRFYAIRVYSGRFRCDCGTQQGRKTSGLHVQVGRKWGANRRRNRTKCANCARKFGAIWRISRAQPRSGYRTRSATNCASSVTWPRATRNSQLHRPTVDTTAIFEKKNRLPLASRGGEQRIGVGNSLARTALQAQRRSSVAVAICIGDSYDCYRGTEGYTHTYTHVEMVVQVASDGTQCTQMRCGHLPLAGTGTQNSETGLETGNLVCETLLGKKRA